MAEPKDEETSYIDYEAFIDPDFSPTAFANSLILSTNDPSDTPLDLTTPLSRVLFDVQEVDTLIDSLTTKSALPLLEYTSQRADASNHILDTIEAQIKTLDESYAVLQKEVVERYEEAELTRLAADRLCETVRLARALGRCLLAGRQLEVQMGEVNVTSSSTGSSMSNKGDPRAMTRAASTLLAMRGTLQADKPGGEGYMMGKLDAIKTLKSELLDPTEKSLVFKAQQIIREFSISSLSLPGQETSTNYGHAEETRSRTTAAVTTLYLLSPVPSGSPGRLTVEYEPTVLVNALTEYVQTALKSSIASLARSLATLPTLDRTLSEVAARCQNVLALEALLSNLKPPVHLIAGLSESKGDRDGPMGNLLRPLLDALDTSSLPSYFWRTLANNMSPRVRDIIAKGGVSARTLKTNRDKVRDDIRACVERGSRMPTGILSAGVQQQIFDREAAVMVSSIVGVLGR